jgi:hypothetical protein
MKKAPIKSPAEMTAGPFTGRQFTAKYALANLEAAVAEQNLKEIAQ